MRWTEHGTDEEGPGAPGLPRREGLGDDAAACHYQIRVVTERPDECNTKKLRVKRPEEKAGLPTIPTSLSSFLLSLLSWQGASHAFLLVHLYSLSAGAASSSLNSAPSSHKLGG